MSYYLISAHKSYLIYGVILIPIPGLSCAKKCKTRCHSALLSQALKVELMETMSSISRPNPSVSMFCKSTELQHVHHALSLCLSLANLYSTVRMRGLERSLVKLLVEYFKLIVQICTFQPQFHDFNMCMSGICRSQRYQFHTIPTSAKSVGRDHIWPHALEESNTSCGSMTEAWMD